MQVKYNFEVQGSNSTQKRAKLFAQKARSLKIIPIVFNSYQQFHFPDFIGTSCSFLIIKHLSA